VLLALPIAATLSVGVVALVLPARGVHQRIRALKGRELSWVRAAIEQERDRLRAEVATAAGASRLPSLLAYEQRIDSVREWPFDTPTLTRFALFLLVPLGSWLGGALVERLLDVALE
jgi:hypothetical protein